MELQWIGTAFLFGWLAQRLRQPPVLGFLAAGFALEALQLRPDVALEELAGLGVQLLLFTIGLKLDLRSLSRPYVWGFAVAHMAAGGLVAAAWLGLLAASGLGPFGSMSLEAIGALSFALSFSSTILALRVLEERNDLGAIYGQVALGILVVQDLAAVAFLAAGKGEAPSPWALALLLLIPLRRWLWRLLDRTGHGELLVLAGLAATLAVAAAFEAVGLKGDLGALVAGLLLGGSRKAAELSRALLSLKDVFLVGFFLSVGLTGLPTWSSLVVALGLLAILPVKTALFFFLGTAFRLRARTAFLVGTSLTQVSEFGLIVLVALVSKDQLPSDWLTAFALALAISFVLSLPLNEASGRVYLRTRGWLRRFERAVRIPPERSVDATRARVLIFGMGRLGTAAYDRLVSRGVIDVVGFDLDPNVVARHTARGRRVVLGSATDADLFERLHVDREDIEWVLLAMTSHQDHLAAIDLLREEDVRGKLVVTARHPDEVDELVAHGANVALHVFDEAGAGLAAHVLEGDEGITRTSTLPEAPVPQGG